MQILFIENNIDNLQQLVQGAAAGTEIHILDASQDGLQQMATILAGRHDIDALHILTHGNEAAVNLGSLTLTSANMSAHTADLHSIGSALKPGADILLYGCDLAQGSDGAAFISQLAAITGADIAASTDLTGAASLGGNWVLERSSGHIETAAMSFPGFQGVLIPVPTPSTPDLTNASDSGASNSDNITNNTTPTFSGTTRSNFAVTLYDTDGTTVLGTTMGDGSGHWSITSSTLGPGGHLITAKASQGVSTSNASPGLNISIDTTAPGAPSTPVLDSASDTGASNSDNITNATTPTMSGTAEANATIKLYDTDGTTVLGTVTTDGSGNWSVTSSTLSDGDHTLTVTATDVAGNVSAASSSLLVHVDTSTPAAPSGARLDSASDTGPSHSGAFTNLITPTLTGTAEAGAAITLYDTDSTTVLGTAVADGSGNWSITTTTLSEGTHSVKTTATDAAGNVSGFSNGLGLHVDTTPPTTPSAATLDSASDTGRSHTDRVTSDTTPTLTGTASANSAVLLFDTDGTTVVGSGNANGSGNWSITTNTLSDGSHFLSAKTIDGAGNTSSASASLFVEIDTAAPPRPSTPDLDTASDDGSSHSDNITTITTPVLTGTADANAAVLLLDTDGTTVLGSTTADFSGNWSITTSTLSSGVHHISAVSTDEAGNTSAASSTLDVTIGTAAPPPPPPPPPPVVSTVDGVSIGTSNSTNNTTGLQDTTVNVPVVTAGRVDDGASTHAGLADIPLGIGSSTLNVGVPVGVGLTATGPAALLNTGLAVFDLNFRLASANADATTISHADSYLSGLGSNDSVLIKAISLTSPSSSGITTPGTVIISGGNASSMLVLDTSQLTGNTAVQLDKIGFASVTGGALVSGGAEDNIVIGTGNGNNGSNGSGQHFALGAGNDTAIGSSGDDMLSGARSDTGTWQFYLDASGKVQGVHTGTGGVVETVAGSGLDGSQAALSFLNAPAQQVQGMALLYESAFHRAPDLAGLNYWLTSGSSMLDVAKSFLSSAEAGSHYSAQNDQQFVTGLYQDVLHRAGSADEISYWVNSLEAATAPASRAQVLLGFALSTENKGLSTGSAGIALGGVTENSEQGWISGSGNDRLEGGGGNNLLVGGDGTDTVVYTGARSSYHIELTATGDVTIVGATGTDTLRQIEKGEFSDGTVDLAFTKAAPAQLKQIALTYEAVLGRAADLGGISYWANGSQDAMGLAQSFLNSAEFTSRFGTLDNAAFVSLIEQNALQHAPDSASTQQWVSYLATHSRAEMIVALVGSADVQAAQYGAHGLVLV
ncbi:Ig-like domain-containing protein [Undibacterium sp.]|uniref:Ig-like domain-containing protein n=1 Tax=Undibacterium sp. TaxID=1914977 RepID=UPI00374DFA73